MSADMKFKNIGKIFLGPFITTVVVLVIIVISVIFAAVSQTNGSVQQSTEEHAISDMKENSDAYAKSIRFSLENGVSDLDVILNSDTFTFRIVFVTDREGNILSRSNLARYTIKEDNVFDFFAGGTYLDGSEEDAREALKGENIGVLRVAKQQKEYLIFRPLGDDGTRFFYMLHQGDVERMYAESEKYLQTVRSLGIAYVTATVGLVILMGSYIFFVARTSEFKLKLSNLNVRKAQEQVRTYSDITKVLSQSYDKIFYVNAANDHYRVFTTAQAENQSPLQSEGESFWSVICDDVLGDTVPEDRARVREFFDKQNLTESVRREGTRRIRFMMNVDGVSSYFSVKACPSVSDGQRYLIVGLKNVDALVIHDMNQIAEKDAALRRVEIYRSALLDNMLAFLEVDLTSGLIVEGPIAVNDRKEMRHVDVPGLALPLRFDDVVEVWSKRVCKTEAERAEFVKKNSTLRLRQEFESGHSIIETDYGSTWLDGTARDFRHSYYMSKREKNGEGNVAALCVLYDMTEKISHEREIRNLTEELNQSRIKISTGQMQPHFLYNVLGSIREIILEDPQYASDLICDFTTHLRACIKSLSNDELVPFSREVENIKAYVNIERMRFGDRMQVEFAIRYDDFMVVPLSIQPLVENAIRHGLYPKKGSDGLVRISAFRENGFTVIVVKDNGVGFDYEKVTQEIREHKRDSTGLLNLTLRLEKIMNAKVYFDSRIGEGTTVTILIPDKKEENGNESDHR